jgi:UDP-2-acetamido-2,6-beta-L-arabino-hexul-4-ose reductase
LTLGPLGGAEPPLRQERIPGFHAFWPAAANSTPPDIHLDCFLQGARAGPDSWPSADGRGLVMKVVLTGAGGFLGWHVRARLQAVTNLQVVPVTRQSWPDLGRLTADADAVLHLAGVTSGSDQQVLGGNIALAEELSAAVRSSGARPRIVFANSVDCGDPTPHGEGKARAAEVLAGLAGELGVPLVDVRLPSLFGEHGRRWGNWSVPTYVEAVAEGRTPFIQDRPVELLHAQQAAQTLIDALDQESGLLQPPGTATSVQTVYDKLVEFRRLYARGDIPPLPTDFDLDLFNTLRAAMFPSHHPIQLAARYDDYGSQVDLRRVHGGPSQQLISMTRPGMSRGEHYHLRTVERIVVLAGRATITLRRLFGSETVAYAVSSVRPCIIDVPTLWTREIANTGSSHLTTLVWTNEPGDPWPADTYPAPVAAGARELVGAGVGS